MKKIKQNKLYIIGGVLVVVVLVILTIFLNGQKSLSDKPVEELFGYYANHHKKIDTYIETYYQDYILNNDFVMNGGFVDNGEGQKDIINAVAYDDRAINEQIDEGDADQHALLLTTDSIENIVYGDFNHDEKVDAVIASKMADIRFYIYVLSSGDGYTMLTDTMNLSRECLVYGIDASSRNSYLLKCTNAIYTGAGSLSYEKFDFTYDNDKNIIEGQSAKFVTLDTLENFMSYEDNAVYETSEDEYAIASNGFELSNKSISEMEKFIDDLQSIVSQSYEIDQSVPDYSIFCDGMISEYCTSKWLSYGFFWQICEGVALDYSSPMNAGQLSEQFQSTDLKAYPVIEEGITSIEDIKNKYHEIAASEIELPNLSNYIEYQGKVYVVIPNDLEYDPYPIKTYYMDTIERNSEELKVQYGFLYEFEGEIIRTVTFCKENGVWKYKGYIS